MAQEDRSGVISNTIDALADAGRAAKETFWVIVVLALALSGVVWLLDREIGFTHTRCQEIQQQQADGMTKLQDTFMLIIEKDKIIGNMIMEALLDTAPSQKERERFFERVERLQQKIIQMEETMKQDRILRKIEQKGGNNESN